jgi:hypothetical protein
VERTNDILGMDGILNLSTFFHEWRPSKLKIAMMDRALLLLIGFIGRGLLIEVRFRFSSGIGTGSGWALGGDFRHRRDLLVKS